MLQFTMDVNIQTLINKTFNHLYNTSTQKERRDCVKLAQEFGNHPQFQLINSYSFRGIEDLTCNFVYDYSFSRIFTTRRFIDSWLFITKGGSNESTS